MAAKNPKPFIFYKTFGKSVYLNLAVFILMPATHRIICLSLPADDSIQERRLYPELLFATEQAILI